MRRLLAEDSIVVPEEKAQKRGQRYGCLGISPSEELCIGKQVVEDQDRAELDLIYSQRTCQADGVHLNLGILINSIG